MPLTAQFKTSKRVVVADLEGPAVITMIHFALPEALKLNRDLRVRMYWDHEIAPSVDAPLVDFFCDPAGAREEVNTALLNKRRGFNAYFPTRTRSSTSTARPPPPSSFRVSRTRSDSVGASRRRRASFR